ncbi:MAG: YgiQ family radical SAM protein [Spirochaetales bacterium]|nr:YgiQ family radical SAM protein [Spirochaetales bacterium]
MNNFLPVSKTDMDARGWDSCDFLLVTGDAYVDHPSFGAAIISRVLESEGYKVGIISQPDWRTPESLKILGRPRYAFLVTSGNMDSMVSHYTVAKKRRKRDSYSPGGEGGKRPDRATIVYANLVRQAYKKIPIIIGGIEASLRRFAHYDYWRDSLRRSILLDSKADLLVYGMGEKQILNIAKALAEGTPATAIRDIPGTVYSCSAEEVPPEAVVLPSHEDLRQQDVKKRYRAFAESFRIQYRNADPFQGKKLVEAYGSRYVVQNPPEHPLGREELDRVYELPYTKAPHPDYLDGVPALEEVKFSLVSNRGCFGACSFCALAFHQGRIVTSRSVNSLVAEARNLTGDPDFKGYIHDVGGPTANFRFPACRKQETLGSCPDKQCLFPKPCKNLKVDHGEYLEALRTIRKLPGIKKVFIRSGIRFDYLIADPEDTFMRELCEHHISGQLKVAPEHVSSRVLKAMGKPGREIYDEFAKRYRRTNEILGKKQYLVPYFISSHPGSRLEDAIELAEYLRDTRFIPDQVQDFYPTPGTLSTCMFYTGIDPRTMKPVYVPKTHEEKSMQRALLQYRKPENYSLVKNALRKAGRQDLIGNGPKALIPPYQRGKSRGKRGRL